MGQYPPAIQLAGRPNLVVATSEPFIDESWLGGPVRIGTHQDVACAVFDRVPQRCVMAGMRQLGLPESSRCSRLSLRAAVTRSSWRSGSQVTRPGAIRVGDPLQAAANR